MKKYYLAVAIIGALFLFWACQNGQKASQQTADSTTAAKASMADPAAPYAISGRVADLGLTSDSDWRGINLGDEFDRVKTTAKEAPFENDSAHSGYTIELKNLETADVLYYQTNNRVSAIGVDLFLNNRQSVTDYQKELDAYFTNRYGTPKPGDGGTVWTGQKGERVTLKDVSKGKDFGLKIKIYTGSGTATTSAK